MVDYRHRVVTALGTFGIYQIDSCGKVCRRTYINGTVVEHNEEPNCLPITDTSYILVVGTVGCCSI